MTRTTDTLSLAAVDVQPTATDWWPDDDPTWTSYEAPTTESGDYARWDIYRRAWIDQETGGEVEPDPENGCEGPMMNYRYELPAFNYMDGDLYQAADAIRDLPLCIIDHEDGIYLALTGGGMDLSWEVCAAYVRLGYCPPAFYAADLPDMAGGPSIPEILPACRRSLEHAAERATARLERFERQYGER